MKGSGLWSPPLQLHPPPPPPHSHTSSVGERVGKESSSATSSRYFTLPQHHSEVEGRRCDCFHPQSPEREGRDQRRKERGCTVSDPAACELSVEGDELCLCTARHNLRGLLLCLLLLLLLLRATRSTHLAEKDGRGKNSKISED